MKILITGGTVFVSQFTAEYFVKKGHEVYVLNRNSHPQSDLVHLIESDRHSPDLSLAQYDFDAVLDITAYDRADVEDLLRALGHPKQYILVSSSAVYPETTPQPFAESAPVGPNAIWGSYGLGKIAAEEALLSRVPHAYIVRPPYLYGPMQNLYREAFVFDCADLDRPFYLPQDGSMPLQFFHVEDLCRFMEILLRTQPDEHIFNVGDPEAVSIRQWVSLCYAAAGKTAQFISVDTSHAQRSFFPFHDYGYILDVEKQQKLMLQTKPLSDGLKEDYLWHIAHRDRIKKKDYLSYIDKNLS